MHQGTYAPAAVLAAQLLNFLLSRPEPGERLQVSRDGVLTARQRQAVILHPHTGFGFRDDGSAVICRRASTEHTDSTEVIER